MSNALCRWYHSYSLLPFKCPTSIKYNFNHVYIKSSALFHCKPVLKVSYPNQQNRRVGKVIISSKLFSQQNYSRNLSKSKRKQSKSLFQMWYVLVLKILIPNVVRPRTFPNVVCPMSRCLQSPNVQCVQMCNSRMCPNVMSRCLQSPNVQVCAYVLVLFQMWYVQCQDASKVQMCNVSKCATVENKI